MRGEIIYEYQKLNSEDLKAFRRFLWTNTVVGAILLAGLIALAINVPGDKSEATALNGTVMQPQVPLERTSLPSR